MITVSAPPAWCICCTHPLLGHIARQSIVENFRGKFFDLYLGHCLTGSTGADSGTRLGFPFNYNHSRDAWTS
jgi:hypothetical protein